MSAKSKTPEISLTETKFNLKLGDNIYTLNFGVAAFLRLPEENPKITNPLSVLDDLTGIEAIPALIQAAIKPEDRKWTTKDELYDLFDSCDDPALNKVLTGYISAIGVVSKKLNPAIEAVNAMQSKNA